MSSDYLRARDFLLAHRTDYDTAVRDFRWPRLQHFNWALDYFDALAANNDALALWIVEESGDEARFTFAEMSAWSNRVANALRRSGIRRGDRILVMLGNEPALWIVLLAAFKLGAVVSPATTLLGPADLLDRVERGAMRCAIATRDLDLPGLLQLRVESLFAAAETESSDFIPDGPTSASDPLLLYFTSGTTSRPKLVLHSHESYPVGHLTTMYWMGLQPGDVHWNISSPGWAKHAYSCFFAPWIAGATVFVYNYGRFRAPDVLRILRDNPVTTICAPPTVWRMLIQEKLADYPVRLRELASAGEPLNPEVIDQVRAAWGLDIRDGYGQTETTLLIGNTPGQPVKPGSMGRPMPGFTIVQSGEGEICVSLADRPTGLMLGYEGRDPLAGDSYHTGDIAVRDNDGYFTCVGRTDDVFKASDYRISPFELESALIEHPAVAEAAVVPSPDPVRSRVPKAFVVLSPGYTPCEDVARDIFQFLRANVAPFKRVRRIEFADLPKTISGKIRRTELRLGEQSRDAARRAFEFFEEDFR